MTVGDLLIRGARVFTGTALLPGVASVAIRDGRILVVGDDDEARAAVGPTARAVGAEGRLLTPGFTDAHAHPVEGGLERLSCDLNDASDAASAVELVAAYAESHPERPWITGGGWSMEWFEGGTPRRELLDRVSPDRPVFLTNRDGHGAWVNGRALELAGIDASRTDPDDGRIERDGDGTPTGTLHEGAMNLVTPILPAVTESEQRAALLEAQGFLHALGVTGWQDAIIGDYAGKPDPMPAYLGLAQEGLLTARVVGALWWPRGIGLDGVQAVVDELVRRRALAPAGRFRATSVKMMKDGVAENFTAQLSAPYLDRCGHAADNAGISFIDPDVMARAVTLLDAQGFQVHVHVIGDAAAREALDAFESARRSNGMSENRHHLAHLQVIDPVDVPRFAELGATANLQALWACHEPQMDELTIPFLGEERTRWQYPFGDLSRSGATLAMGSDWPVSSPDPWQAIHVAVNRIAYGESTPPLEPEQGITLTTALSAYTRGSAVVNHLDDGGLVEPGMIGDVVLLDRNPFDLESGEIGSTSVDLTVVDGAVVHER